MPRQSAYRSEVLTRPEPVVMASARNYTLGKQPAPTTVTDRTGMLGDPWQNTAWDFYDIVCELRYTADFVGNLLSKAVLFVTQDGKPTTDPRAVKALNDLFGGAEGQAEMLKALGIHYTIAGEAIIIGQAGQQADEWYVVASTEVTRTRDNTFTVNGGYITVDPSKSLTIRLWREHPRKPWKANSPTRACIPVLRELDKLTQHVAAQIDSRLISAGILWVPSEMSFPSSPITKTDDTGAITSQTQQTVSSAQALSDMLREVAEIAIADRSDAAALVPIIVQVAGEFLQNINKTEFWSGLDEHSIELRNEAIRRLSLGMDMPPEIVTGVRDTNHWAAWQVDESAIKAHSEPLLSAITYALTTGYLRLVLEADMSPEEAAHFSIGADTSAMRVRPNRSKEAVELYDRGELSGEAMRRENGFDEEDAMDDTERVTWLTKKLASGQTTPELVAEGLKMLGVALPDAMIADAVNQHEARPDRSIKQHPVRDIPDTQDDAANPDGGTGVSAAGVLMAAEMMVFRALERAGNRLKGRGVVGKPTTTLATVTTARTLYLQMPRLTEAEIDDLLIDAWSCTEWEDWGLDAHALSLCLDGYTRTLLATRKPHERALLRQHLELALALEPMQAA